MTKKLIDKMVKMLNNKIKNILIIIIIMILLASCSVSNVKTEKGSKYVKNVFNNKELQRNNSNVQYNKNKVLEPTEENFLKILETNKDGSDYLKNYPNTKVIKITKILPENFEMLRNKTRYKELYEKLPNKELYRVDFGSYNTTKLILLTVIDLEKQKVLKIYGNYVIGLSS